MDTINNNYEECEDNIDITNIYINNLKSMCYEVNNIDSMIRTKIVLIDDDIKWLRKTLNNTLENYMVIISNNFE